MGIWVFTAGMAAAMVGLGLRAWHRERTLQRADEVLLLDEGEVLELDSDDAEVYALAEWRSRGR